MGCACLIFAASVSGTKKFYRYSFHLILILFSLECSLVYTTNNILKHTSLAVKRQVLTP
jgi:hypothetical protein